MVTSSGSWKCILNLSEHRTTSSAHTLWDIQQHATLWLPLHLSHVHVHVHTCKLLFLTMWTQQFIKSHAKLQWLHLHYKRPLAGAWQEYARLHFIMLYCNLTGTGMRSNAMQLALLKQIQSVVENLSANCVCGFPTQKFLIYIVSAWHIIYKSTVHSHIFQCCMTGATFPPSNIINKYFFRKL